MPIDLHGPEVRAAILRQLEADPAPSAPKGDHGPLHKYGIPALVAGDMADAVTTIQALKRPGTYEANPIAAPFGTHPAAMLAFKGGSALVKALILEKLADRHPKWAAGLGVGLGAYSGALALRNTRQGK